MKISKECYDGKEYVNPLIVAVECLAHGSDRMTFSEIIKKLEINKSCRKIVKNLKKWEKIVNEAPYVVFQQVNYFSSPKKDDLPVIIQIPSDRLAVTSEARYRPISYTSLDITLYCSGKTRFQASSKYFNGQGSTSNEVDSTLGEILATINRWNSGANQYLLEPIKVFGKSEAKLSVY